MINSQADLEALPVPQKNAFLQTLAKSIHNWDWDKEAQDWVLRQDFALVERLGLTIGDLPQVELPPKPPKPVEPLLLPDPAGAAIQALSPGTPEFEVFAWMTAKADKPDGLKAANAQRRINENLTAHGQLWGINRQMANDGLDAAFVMLWDAVSEIPDGYQDIVNDWREKFRLRAE